MNNGRRGDEKDCYLVPTVRIKRMESSKNEISKMPQSSIKQRLLYAKRKAIKQYKKLGAIIINHDDKIISFTASFTTHENKVRVVIDEIKDHDFKLLKNIYSHPNQSSQIFCQLYKEKDPRIVEIIDDKNIKILYDPIFPELRLKIMSKSKYLKVLSCSRRRLLH